MATTQNIELFKGEGWNECDAFIRNIRAAAWKEGKLRDPDWMADFASMYFSDEALAWYSHLPRDIQENWPKLQAALVDRWLPSNNQCKPKTQNEPVPAAAPSPKENEKKDYFERGILKAIVTGDEKPYYVQINPSGRVLSLTEDAKNALRFCFGSHTGSKFIECSDGPPYSWLAIHWHQTNPDFGRGSVHFSYLTRVDSETLKSSYTGNGPFQVLMCRVSDSGEATFLRRSGNTETPIVPFTQGIGLFYAADPDAYQQENIGEKRVTLFIQKVD